LWLQNGKKLELSTEKSFLSNFKKDRNEIQQMVSAKKLGLVIKKRFTETSTLTFHWKPFQSPAAGLPDFSWDMTPKPEKCTK
jgi:hypothetical protein